jgi:hypothetical protein
LQGSKAQAIVSIAFEEELDASIAKAANAIV